MSDLTLVADIQGYASIFNTRDMNGDVIERGAFTNSLAGNPTIRMLYQHAAETPIGRWTSITEDDHGLFVTGEILLSSPRAREIHVLLMGGALDGLSIGFQTLKARKGDAKSRRIIETDLWEVSIVTFPMAKAARITHIGAPRVDQSISANLTDSARAIPPTLHAVLPSRVQDWARPVRRALVSPPTSARHFADALRSAAAILSV